MFSHMYLNVFFLFTKQARSGSTAFLSLVFIFIQSFLLLRHFSNHVTVTRNDSHHFLNIYNILCILPHCVFKLLNFLKKVAVTNRLGFNVMVLWEIWGTQENKINSGGSQLYLANIIIIIELHMEKYSKIV